MNNELKQKTERLLALADAATKDWRLRKHPHIEHQCFVESPPANGMAYGLEVFGDDYTGYGDEEQREKDMEFAASAHAMAAHIRALQAENDRLRDQQVPDGWVAVPIEPSTGMQAAGARAIRIDTTVVNKLWTGNTVYKAMLAAAPSPKEKTND